LGCVDAVTSWRSTDRRTRLERHDPFDVASALLIAALLGLALLSLRHYSISNDEEVQHRYGQMILAYYASDLTDRSLFNFQNLYLYGGLFDVVALLLGHILPGDIFAIRHGLCAVTGVGGIVATWAIARMIAGPRAGALAALALAVCGVWYGAMFNHTKDIPFAAAMIGATYFLLRATRDLPRPRLSDLLYFWLLMGAALGQRALGLLFLCYVPIAIALHAPRPFALSNAARFLGRSLVLFVPAFALAYLVMVAAWPWAVTGLLNPIRAIFAFTHFQYPIKTLLSGTTYLMGQVPRTYVPIYLAIKLPLVLLTGAALSLLAIVRIRAAATAIERLRVRETVLVAVTAIVPVLLHVAGHGPAFSGMRHFTFVVPPLAVLAGIGFNLVLEWAEARSRRLARAAFAGVAVWLLWTGSVLMRLHPYEYLYFNETVGGLRGAAQRYDTDYWVNIMHEAVTGLEQVLDREGQPPRHYLVAVCGERLPFEHEAARYGRLRLAAGDDRADFFIAPTHMRCDQALDGTVIVKIERMGTLIGVVKDRRGLPVSDLMHNH
jgi:hypothetical protein